MEESVQYFFYFSDTIDLRQISLNTNVEVLKTGELKNNCTQIVISKGMWDLFVEDQGHKTIHFDSSTISTHTPNLKGLSNIFELLHPTNIIQ